MTTMLICVQIVIMKKKNIKRKKNQVTQLKIKRAKKIKIIVTNSIVTFDDFDAQKKFKVESKTTQKNVNVKRFKKKQFKKYEVNEVNEINIIWSKNHLSKNIFEIANYLKFDDTFELRNFLAIFSCFKESLNRYWLNRNNDFDISNKIVNIFHSLLTKIWKALRDQNTMQFILITLTI